MADIMAAVAELKNLAGANPEAAEGESAEEQPAEETPQNAATEEAEPEEASEAEATEDADSVDVPVEEDAASEIFEFKHNGEMVQATLDELVQGFVRGDDYHKRRDELAEQSKSYTEGLGTANQRLQEYGQQLEHAIVALAAASGARTPESMAALQAEDPVAWATAVQEDHQRSAMIQQAQALLQQNVEQQRANMIAMRDEQLTAAVPDWRVQATRDNEMKEIGEFLSSKYGISAAEWQGIPDPRSVRVARDLWLATKDGDNQGSPQATAAVRVARSAADTPKAQANGNASTRVIKPKGRRVASGNAAKARQALQAHAKTQSRESAVAALRALANPSEA